MAYFVSDNKNLSKYINLDHARYIHERRDGSCIVRDADNGVMGEIRAADVPPNDSHIIPNTTVTSLIEFWLDQEDKITHARYAVVAWRVNGAYVSPLVLENNLNNVDSDIQCFEQRIGDRTSYVIDEQVVESFQEAQELAAQTLRRKRQVSKQGA